MLTPPLQDNSPGRQERVEEEGYPGSLVSARPAAPPTEQLMVPGQADQIKANRQEAAARARAAKAAKAVETQAAVSNQVAGAPGPTDPIDLDGPEPNGQDHAAEDMGLDDPNMSPAEAKEAGLVLMRELFGAGKVAEMKAIQKAWQVAKFYDIPVERGHEFYRQALQAMHETGLRK